jgi:Mn-containing catalase
LILLLYIKLIENTTVEELKKAGLEGHYADHRKVLFYTYATGNPWTATYIQAKFDSVAESHENVAADQKAKVTYENLYS